MRSRRSVQPKMVIPSVGDIFDLSTLETPPTPYEIIKVELFPTNTKINFRLYQDRTNKNNWDLVIDSQGNKKILDISGNYIISEFRKPPISSRNPPNVQTVSQQASIKTDQSQAIPRSLRRTQETSSTLQSPTPIELNQDFLQNVPNEMLGEIIKSLDPISLLNFCRTSKRIKNFCQNQTEDFWRQRLEQDFPYSLQEMSPKMTFRQYYSWLSYFDTMLVLNLLEHPENYDRFFRFRKFKTPVQLYLFYQQRQRGYPVEAIHPLGYFEHWRGSLKKGEKPFASSPFESKPSDLFSASQVSNFIDFGSRVYHGRDYTEKIKETYKEITGKSLPEYYNFKSPDQYVSWASYLVEFVAGYSYESYDDEDIVTPEETDLNSVGIIIVLLSMLGEKIWEFPIKDTLTGGKTSITLGTLRARLIPKLRNLTLLIPTGFLSDLDKILDRVFIEY